MKKNKYITIIFIFLPLAIGLLSFLITGKDMDLYSQINKPFLAPPKWLFPIVWSILYLLMGLSSAFVYENKDKSNLRKTGLLIHFVQLGLNFLWSIIFFSMKLYFFAFIWLLMLWLSVFFMLMVYKKISKPAYILNIPYIVWLTLAGYLNFAVFILN